MSEPQPPGDVEVVARRIWAHTLDVLLPPAVALRLAFLRPDVGVYAWPLGSLALLLLNVFVAQAFTGQTAGKLLLQIRAVDAFGRPPGLLRNFKRTLPLLVEWLGVFGFVAMVRHPHAQRYGDRWSGTYVIRA